MTASAAPALTGAAGRIDKCEVMEGDLCGRRIRDCHLLDERRGGGATEQMSWGVKTMSSFNGHYRMI